MSGSERSRRVRDLFDRAWELPHGEREAFVRRHADDDPDLRDEVLGYLRADAQGTAAADEQAPERMPPPDALEPEIYRILLGAPEQAIDAGLAALAGGDPARARRIGAIVAWLRGENERDGAGVDLLRRLRQIWSPTRHARRYTKEGEIGGGGCGYVSVVRDRLFDRKVAFKSVHSKWGVTLLQIRRDILHRFLDEVQVAAQLQHPAIPPVHDVGVSEDGVPFFTMRLVRGKSMHDLIGRMEARDPTWSLPRLVRVLVDAAAALMHAHDRQVVHRDVKPGNIMVGRFGEVYVLDWGLAQMRRSTSVAGSAAAVVDRRTKLPVIPLGTKGYAAPEQLRGEASPQVDIFAIGVILHELLVGTRPDIDGDTEHYPMPAAARRRDRRLADIAQLALAIDPSKRYESMAALRSDLVAWLEGRPLQASPPGLRQRLDDVLGHAWRWFGAERAARRLPPPAPESRAVAPARATVATLFQSGGDDTVRASASLQRILDLGSPSSSIQDLGQLAAGGAGVVSLGRDQRLLRKVAVKSLRRDGDRAHDPRAVADFFDEARIAAQLDHPSVLAPFDLVVGDGDTLQLVMPLARGGTLEELADKLFDVRDAWRTTVPLLLQASRGLAWAHAKGVVHCDVTPRNIVLGAHQDAYMLDWGQARLLPADEVAPDVSLMNVTSMARRRIAVAEDRFAGTIDYASPEQARGEAARRGHDVFGLGGVLFRLLTGRPPRTSRDIPGVGEEAWLVAAQTQPIPPVRRVARRVPRALANVCDQALHFEAADRHIDAGAFALALEEALLRTL